MHNTKYRANFYSKRGVTGVIDIKKNDYSGAVIPITLKDDGIKINYTFKDWYEPIIGQSCSLAILNDSSDFFSLNDLMELDEKEFRVTIDASDAEGTNVLLFDGFINSDTVQSRYLNNSVFNVTASNYISKLKDVTPDIIETQSRSSLIDVLSDTLKTTGKDDDIWVNCTLDSSTHYHEGSYTGSLFNNHAIDTELFWKNNTERDGGEKVISDILKPFDCYLYWWDGKWMIERYNDASIGGSGVDYIVYDKDTSYEYDSSTYDTSTYEYSIKSICDNYLTGSSQNINMTPGLKKLKFILRGELYLNLTDPTFSNKHSILYSYGTYSRPNDRHWNFDWGEVYAPDTWDNAYFQTTNYGSYNQIENAAKFKMTFSGGWESHINTGTNDRLKGVGINTTFQITVAEVDENSPTQLNLKWKWAPTKYFSDIDYTHDSPYNKNGYYLYYFVKEDGTGFDNYLVKDDNGIWYKTAGSREQCYNRIRVYPDDIDKITGVYQADITINLTDVSDGNHGDMRMSAGISWVESIFYDTDPQYNFYMYEFYAGDYVASTNSARQDNIQEFTLEDSSVLNKKDVELKIFDVDDLAIRNAVFTDIDFAKRTRLWTTDGYEYSPLFKTLAIDRWKLYSSNRKVITSNVISNTFMKPFNIWRDDQDPSTKQYILTNYSYTPTQDSYVCSWWEYNNDDDINIT